MTDPPVLSALAGNNADLIAEVCRLYVEDGMVVADVTFGMGAFWHRTDTSRFTLLASDIEPTKSDMKSVVGAFQVADFSNLPYPTNSVDVVVLDPPYIHSPGRHQTDHRYNNAATTKGFYHNDILDLYCKGMIEAQRVLKPGGFLWVKCMDQVMSSKQQWGHIDLFQVANELGYYGRDLFVLLPTSRTSKGRWKVQYHARKVHSYLWIFQNGQPKKLRR